MGIGYPIAVCDVDQKHAGQAAEAAGKKKGGKCDVHGDFRKLLDRKDIDAVIIATPDHWHALTTVRACEAGKDVDCEKPLTLTIAEGRAMVDAARKHKAHRADRLAATLVRQFPPSLWLVRMGESVKSPGSRLASRAAYPRPVETR